MSKSMLPSRSPNPGFIEDSIIQIIENLDSFNYIYLFSPDGYSSKNAAPLSTCMRQAKDFDYCTEISTHPDANLVCQDCQKFCKQRCLSI